MIEFIKKIFKKWFGIFSLIASISGLFLFYTGIDTNNLIVKLLTNHWLIISLIFLLISSYQVWLDMKNENIKLEDKLKNPVDYEIKAYKQNINIDLNYIENIFDKNSKNIDKILLDIDNEIESLSVNDKHTTNVSKLLSIHSNSIFHNNSKSDELYVQELKNYILELKEYKNKKDNFLLTWKNFINNDLKNIYYINFTIKNIGTISDEDIDIKIMHNNRYIVDLYLLDTFPKIPSVPVKPKRENVTILRQTMNSNLDINKMHRLTRDSNPLTYRRYEAINDSDFRIKLRDLKVSEEVQIFRQNGFFIYIENENNFNVNIVSKKSNSAIKKEVIVIQGKDYNYFEKKKI